MKLPRVTTTYSGIKNKPFILTEDVNFTLSNGDNMLIKKGYLTDFASVPFWSKPFIATRGEYSEAAVIHDFLYNYRHYVEDKHLVRFPVSRQFADNEFKYQMKMYGANCIIRNIFWLYVRAFGWIRFGKI